MFVGAGLVGAPWSRTLAAPLGEGDIGEDGFPDLAAAKGDAETATQLALDAIGGLKRFIKPGQVVVIKPNASFETPPEWGATTHPEVLAAVVSGCLAADARRVLVVDHTMRNPERCFARSGTTDALAGFSKTKLVSLDKEKSYRAVQVPLGKVLHETEIPVVLEKADLFINVPTAKSHSATTVSFGLKNLMGLVYDRNRFHNDMDLHQAVADLATVLRPQLTILDAMNLLKTGGPTGPGSTEAFHTVIAGVDPVAVDSYGVGLSPWNGSTYAPTDIAHIRYAEELGLGTTKLDSLRIAEVG